jgi:hypothetical protein
MGEGKVEGADKRSKHESHPTFISVRTPVLGGCDEKNTPLIVQVLFFDKSSFLYQEKMYIHSRL